jgi:hypothetical protein
MIIICGATIAEVERDLEMAKQAIASGMPYGVGGATIEDAEKGLEMMQAMMGGAVAPISNPNYDPCDGCPHWKPNNECEVGYDCEDEDEDICPECGATYDEGWNGEVCDNCGYGCEDKPPIVTALADMLRSLGVDEATIGKLMQSALGL